MSTSGGQTNVLGPVSIDENQIHDFAFYGIRIRQDAGKTTDVSQFDVNENNIVDNGLLGVLHEGTGTLDATCNWWDSASGPTAADNPSGTGDGVSENVNYRPWLDGAAPGGSCAVNTPPSAEVCKNCVSYVQTGGRNKADG